MMTTKNSTTKNTEAKVKLTNEELTEKYKKFAEEGGPLHGLFEVLAVMDGNYKVDGINGHPFTIGPKHVEHAADKCGGILGEHTLNAIHCAHPRCARPFHAHTSEKILLVNLCRNLENKEAGNALFAIKEEMERDGLTGVGFACGFKKFKISPPEVDKDKNVV